MGEQPNDQDQPTDHTQRDADTFFILGGFITILALPVLAGIFWEESAHARIVNIGAGLVLLGIGILMLYRGFALRGRIKS